MNARRQIVAAISLVLVLAGAAWPAELFVDQKHPKADDKNAGTEALPFKTIQPAVDAARPGDTIWVKAGSYSEVLRIVSKSGRISAPITLSAWKDDRVHIGFAPRPLPPADRWKPIPGSKSYAAVMPEPLPEDVLVLFGDKPVVTQLKDNPPADDQPVWATYRKSDRTLMINASGKNPFEAGYKQYTRGFEPFVLDGCDHWLVRRIEFGWLRSGLYLENCCNVVVEDCYFHHTARGAIGSHGRTNTFRRCNFYRCGNGIGGGMGMANIIEENLIVDCGMTADEDIDSRPTGGEGGGGPTWFKGEQIGQVFRYNTIVEGAGAGWYADIGAKSCRLIGNAFWNIPPGGGMGAIYNELAVDDTLVMGNYFFNCGVCSSYCSRMSVVDNFFDQCSAEWLNRDPWPMRHGYMVLRGNAFVNPGGGYLHTYGPGWSRTSYPEGFNNCLVDFNRIRAKEGATLVNDGGANRQVKSLEDIRKTYGWEIHGEVKAYDPDKNDLTPEAMGGSTVTYRVPWGKRSHLARPMLSNADIEGCWPGSPEEFSTGQVVPGFFWHVADGNNDPTTLIRGQPWAPRYFRNLPDSMDGYNPGENAGCRWFIDAERKYPQDMVSKKTGFGDTAKFSQEGITGFSSGNHWLVMEGRTPEKIPPQGVGYWSPLLATAPGAEITVSMRIRGKDLVSSDKGSPAVWLEFTNETGQKRQRAFLVGKDDQGKMHHEEYTKGSYDWKLLKEVVKAPEGAIRMALFFGVLPCKGELDFDDINLKTASAPGVVAREILQPRMPLARIREVFFVDLLTVANRSLVDENENDGKGGWTDQGPNCDMRELATGKRSFGGVNFNILPGAKGIVVLKSSMREAAGMPEKVTIPVGRKFDTIFFLHAAAWFNGDAKFRYVIHYADGKDVEIPVTRLNLVDWVSEPVDRFPNEAGTFSTVAETVKVPQYSQGSVYRMEWSAPQERRSVEIKSIEFIGDGRCVPVLLGITGVMEW